MVTGASGVWQADTCPSPLETCINLHIFTFHEERHDAEHGKGCSGVDFKFWLLFLGYGLGTEQKDKLCRSLRAGRVCSCVVWNGEASGVYGFCYWVLMVHKQLIAESHQCSYGGSDSLCDHAAAGKGATNLVISYPSITHSCNEHDCRSACQFGTINTQTGQSRHVKWRQGENITKTGSVV